MLPFFNCYAVRIPHLKKICRHVMICIWKKMMKSLMKTLMRLFAKMMMNRMTHLIIDFRRKRGIPKLKEQQEVARYTDFYI